MASARWARGRIRLIAGLGHPTMDRVPEQTDARSRLRSAFARRGDGLSTPRTPTSPAGGATPTCSRSSARPSPPSSPKSSPPSCSAPTPAARYSVRWSPCTCAPASWRHARTAPGSGSSKGRAACAPCGSSKGRAACAPRGSSKGRAPCCRSGSSGVARLRATSACAPCCGSRSSRTRRELGLRALLREQELEERFGLRPRPRARDL